jgi:hypothetical protein
MPEPLMSGQIDRDQQRRRALTDPSRIVRESRVLATR